MVAFRSQTARVYCKPGERDTRTHHHWSVEPCGNHWNPGYDVTRGLPIESVNDSDWVGGPAFLKINQWPFRAPVVGEFLVELLARKGTSTQHAVSLDETESVFFDSFLTIKLSKCPIMNFKLLSNYRKVLRVLACFARLLSVLKEQPHSWASRIRPSWRLTSGSRSTRLFCWWISSFPKWQINLKNWQDPQPYSFSRLW